MNLRIITKNHAADSKMRFLTKSILKPYGRVTAMPPAWELRRLLDINHFWFNFVEQVSYTSFK